MPNPASISVPGAAHLAGQGEQRPLLSAQQVRWVWTLLAIGLACRLFLVVWYTPRHSWSGDAGDYLKWGMQLAQTGHYLQTPAQDKMPGMAALVAAGYWMGGETGARLCPLILFALMATAGAAGLWSLLLPYLRPSTRIPALAILLFGVMELLLPVFRLLPDVPAMVLAIGAVCALVCGLKNRYLFHGMLAGVALGLSMYLRPDYSLVVLALAGAWVLVAWKQLGMRRAVTVAIAMGATAGILLVPWGVRNWQLTGKFHVFSNHGQRMLWWAFNDGRYLDSVADGAPWAGAPVEEQGHIAQTAALRWIRQHPLDAAWLVLGREVSHIRPYPPVVITSGAEQISCRVPRLIYRFSTLAVHELWVVLGLAALIVGFSRLPMGIKLLGAVLVARLAIAALLPDAGRYALFTVPFLCCCCLANLETCKSGITLHCPRCIILIGIGVIMVQLLFVAVWGLPGCVPALLTYDSVRIHNYALPVVNRKPSNSPQSDLGFRTIRRCPS